MERLQAERILPPQALELGRPRFTLRGLAIGNGMTDPHLQVVLYGNLMPFSGKATNVAFLMLQESCVVLLGRPTSGQVLYEA